MVGIAVGLFVVAAAAALVSNQLGDNRRLLLETQVQQDLRASMDIITRQLRRAGATNAVNVQGGLATAPGAGGIRNLYSTVEPAAAADSVTTFEFYFDPSQHGPYGFKLEGGIIKTLLQRINAPEFAWNELTDPNTLVVTAFSITPRTLSSVRLPCPKLCPGGLTDCWPQVVVRDYVVEIQARAKSDPAVRRSLRNEVRIRNDLIKFNDPAVGSPVCPI